jgi:hypothetical protein
MVISSRSSRSHLQDLRLQTGGTAPVIAPPEATGSPVWRPGSGKSEKGMTEVIESTDLQAEPNRRELRTVLDAAPVALFWASLTDFNVRSANHAFTDRFGTLDGCFTSVEQWLDAACCHPDPLAKPAQR